MHKKVPLFIILFFTACTSPTTTATPGPVPSQTPASTQAPAPTPAPALTPTPVPTHTSTPVPTASLTPTPGPISSQNADQLMPLKLFQAPVIGFKWYPIVSFSPDFKRYTTSLDAKSLILWDAESGQQISTLAGISEIFPVVFAPDGKTLASGDDKGNVIIWDAATGQQIRVMSGFSRGLTRLIFSPDSKIIAATSYMVKYDETLVLLDAATGQPLHLISCNGFCTVVAFSPDGATLATNSFAAQKDKIVLRDASTGKQIGSPLTGSPFGISSLAFSPDGRLLASGDVHNTIILWDASSGKQLSVFDHLSRKTGVSSLESGIFAIAFSPDGQTLATGYGGGSIILWDVATTRPVFVFKSASSDVPFSGLVDSLAFSADGRQLASTNKGNTGAIWGISGLPVPTPTAIPTASTALVSVIDTSGSFPANNARSPSKSMNYSLHDAGVYTVQLQTNDNTNLCWLKWWVAPKTIPKNVMPPWSGDSNIPATFTLTKAADYVLSVSEVFFYPCQAFAYTLKVTRPELAGPLTQANEFNVQANLAWQDTGVVVNPGDILTIKYKSGNWGWTADRSHLDGNGDPDFNGTYLNICTERSDCPLNQGALSALAGRIGMKGKPFSVGDSVTYTVPGNTPENQSLFLMGNDTPGGLHDNVGSIVVEITVQYP